MDSNKRGTESATSKNSSHSDDDQDKQGDDLDNQEVNNSHL